MLEIIHQFPITYDKSHSPCDVHRSTTTNWTLKLDKGDEQPHVIMTTAFSYQHVRRKVVIQKSQEDIEWNDFYNTIRPHLSNTVFSENLINPMLCCEPHQKVVHNLS